MEELKHLPQHSLERMLADLLRPEEKELFRKHLGQCPACAARLAEARAARESFLSTNPPDIRARQLLARQVEAPRRRFFLVPALAAAASLLLLGLLALWRVLPAVEDGPPDILTKGGLLTFQVQRVGSKALEQGLSGDAFAAGDHLQIRVHPPAGRHRVAVFSMDQTGRLSHLMDLEARRAMPLPSSLVVDDSPAPERVFVVFSRDPLETELVRQSAARAFLAAGGKIEPLDSFPIEGVEGTSVGSLLIRKKYSSPAEPPRR